VPLRLFADECVDARVVAGLRRRGVDIITAADECLLHASDEEQFARATHLGRPIVTADHDFLRLACGHWEPARSSLELSLISPRQESETPFTPSRY
jgi:predicted nuclease of predicted toxin-antitoxin system